ncbi:insulinase family protein [Candidatus Peregrinibacteria bacterium]|nr:insulinase family protein [Candidatus Peregrinibacteria bacterium]
MRKVIAQTLLVLSCFSCLGFPTTVSFAAAKTTTTQNQAGLERYALKNGMTAILQPEYATPVVAMNVWVHVGSKDENDATRGLAHIQEHMLFQGTKTYGSGTIFKTIEGLGGNFNAFTSNDETVFHILLPSAHMEKGLSILSSMMHEALIAPSSLKKELEVIMEEFRKDKDNAGRVLYEQSIAKAYATHPYKYPVIGYADTIKNTTADRVQAFYHAWYVPQNMTVILVGDFDPSAAKQMIQSTFGAIAARANPKRAIPPDTPQTSRRITVHSGEFENTNLILMFRNTAEHDRDTATMDTLYTLLGSGESSRLTQVLRERKKLVTDIAASSDTPEQEGMGIISAQLDAANVPAAIPAILQEVYRLKSEPVSEAELAKAKLAVASSFIYQREEYEGMAENLGFLQVVGGDVHLQDAYLKRIADLTPADIQAAAKKYLNDNHLTIGVLYPSKAAGKLTEDHVSALAAQAAKTPVSSSATVVTSRTLDRKNHVTKVIFKNGMTVLLREDHSVPALSFQATFLGGLRVETLATNGVTKLASQLLLRGTTTKDQAAIASQLDSMASGITPFADRVSFGLEGSSLRQYAGKTLDLLGDLLLHSAYPEDQLAQVKSLTLDAISRRRDRPTSQAVDQFVKTLYGDHPYGMQVLGTPESVAALTRDQVTQFASSYLVPQNLVLSVVGDFKTDDVLAQLASTLGPWKSSGTFVMPSLPSPTFPSSAKVAYTVSAKEQSNIFLGFPTMTAQDPNRYSFDVLDAILSNASGRLFSQLRDKQALAYTVAGVFGSTIDQPGYYALYIGCDPSKTDAAIAGLKDQLHLLLEKGITDEELTRAKDLIAGTYVIGLQTFGAQAKALSLEERLGLGYQDLARYPQKIKAVTKADVERMAHRYLNLDHAVLSVVGPTAVK